MKSSPDLSKTPVGERLQEFVRYAELKQLAYNLADMQHQKRFHSLAVLSFFPAEGKTLACASLALAYAEARRAKVLVVDTTTLQNQGSLPLKRCMEASASAVDMLSLDELRKDPSGLSLPASKEFQAGKMTVFEPEVIEETHLSAATSLQSDQMLLQKVSRDSAKSYGLILMDTTPLNVRNKSNVDPLLVARICDASVLVVSQKFLDAPKLKDHLKMLEDPGLHLIGLISNEVFSR